MPKARALHGKLGFGEAKHHLYLPAAHIDKDHTPGIIWGRDRLIGEEVKRRTPLTGPRNHEPEGDRWPERVGDSAEIYTGRALTPATCIPDEAIVQ